MSAIHRMMAWCGNPHGTHGVTGNVLKAQTLSNEILACVCISESRENEQPGSLLFCNVRELSPRGLVY